MRVLGGNGKVVGLWAVLVLFAAAEGLLCDHARVNLAESADFQTIEILNEDYHWAVVTAPRRVDEGRERFVSEGILVYPGVAPLYLPQYLAQLFIPEAQSFMFVHGFSVYVTLLLLTFLFPAGLAAGASAGASFLVTAGLLIHPFMLRLLVAAPVIPSCALVPLAYLALLRRRTVWCALLLLLAAFSYRLGALFLFLFLLDVKERRGAGPKTSEGSGLEPGPSLAVGARKDQSTRAELEPEVPRWLVYLLGSAAGVQVLTQAGYFFFSDYFRGMEGQRVDYVFSVFARFLDSPLDSEAWVRFCEAAAWLATGGAALFLRKRDSRAWLLPCIAAVYVWWVTGAMSQVMLLLLAMSGVALLQALREGRLARWSAVAVPVVAVVAGLVVPTVRSAVPRSQTDARPVVAFSTHAAFVLDALSRHEEPHLLRARAALDSHPGATLCLVEPILLPFVKGRTCSAMVPAGKEALDRSQRSYDLLLLDSSDVAARFREHMARTLRTEENYSALLRENVLVSRDGTRFTKAWSVDGLTAFTCSPVRGASQ